MKKIVKAKVYVFKALAAPNCEMLRRYSLRRGHRRSRAIGCPGPHLPRSAKAWGEGGGGAGALIRAVWGKARDLNLLPVVLQLRE